MNEKSRKLKIKLEKGSLPGYTLSIKQKDRRSVLDKLVIEYGWSNIVKKLNILYVYNKNRYPQNAMKFRKDMFYVQKKYKPSMSRKSKKPKKSRKPRKSMKSNLRKSIKKSRKRMIRKSKL